MATVVSVGWKATSATGIENVTWTVAEVAPSGT